MKGEIIVSSSEDDLVIERNPTDEINQNIVIPEYLAEELIEQIATEADGIQAVEIQTK